MSNEEGNIMNDQEFDKLLKQISDLKVPSSPKGKDKVWNEILQSIDQQETKVVKMTSHTVWYSIAASIIVLLTIGFLVRQYSTISVIVPKGEISSVVLPDKSEVQINADSKIEYKRFGWLKHRQIVLHGEAYFAVNSGNQFIVDAGNGKSVTVKGTEFNVYTRDVTFEVKCFDGSVVVETQKVKPTVINKGKGILVKDDLLEPTTIDLDSSLVSNWLEGEFSYQNTPLNEVFSEVERQFDIVIKSEKFDPFSRYYTGYFKKGKITDALDLICLPMGLQYTFSGDSTSVTVKSE